MCQIQRRAYVLPAFRRKPETYGILSLFILLLLQVELDLQETCNVATCSYYVFSYLLKKKEQIFSFINSQINSLVRRERPSMKNERSTLEENILN